MKGGDFCVLQWRTGQWLCVHLPVSLSQVGAGRARQPSAGLRRQCAGHRCCEGPAGPAWRAAIALLCTGQLFGNIQITLSSKKYTQVSSGHLGSALITALRVSMFMDLVEPPGGLPVIPDRPYSAHSLLHLTSICLDAVSTAPEERFHCLWGSPDKEA